MDKFRERSALRNEDGFVVVFCVNFLVLTLAQWGEGKGEVIDWIYIIGSVLILAIIVVRQIRWSKIWEE
jgi:hypothetical protein